MEVFRSELHVFPLRAILDESKAVLGEEALDEVLEQFGLVFADLTDRSGWVSLEFVEAFIGELVRRAQDRDILTGAMDRAMSPAGIGPLYPLFVAFGSPLFTYRQLPAMNERFNKTGSWEADQARASFVRLTWRPADAPRETRDFVCRTRLLQLGLIPTLFGLAPARVEHTSCLLEGGETCTYEVSWSERDARRDGLWGMLAGGSVAAATAYATGAGLGPSISLAVAASLAGWALGRLRLTQHDLQDRTHEVVESSRALESVTKANEERFAELVEAKREVDQQVEERTAELQSTSQQLAETLEKVQSLDRAKTDFFNNVSHELRSPLTLILGPLQEIVDGREPAGGREAALRTMARNADRLLRLINQILDLAKIDAGDAQVEHRELDPSALVQNVIGDFETAARGKGATLVAQLDAAPARVLWDSAWMESAVGNLVANALRHVDQGGRVEVRVLDAGAEVVIEVEDDGEGIAPDDLQRVFDRFAQGGDSHAGLGGTGLGLAIVREAARLHGGDASVESEPGERTTFRLSIPRTFGGAVPVAEQGSPRAIESRPEPVTRAGEVDPGGTDRVEDSWRDGPSPQAPLALVVEDNADLRVYMADVLSSRYRVRTARDGQQALDMAAAGGIEVVVSDVAMPRMDGYELCRRLRQLDTAQAVPIILVTAAGHLTRVLEGFDAGADDYVTKPFHPRELLARVDVHVKLRSMVREVAQRERLATLGTVAASVAHQVRNPLTTLVSGLPAMRRRLSDKLDPPSLEMLETMLDCSERIQRTTNDLLDLSRVDRSEVATFKPGEGLSSAVRLVATRLESHDVVLDVQVDDAAEMRGRPGDMNQVFMNLLDNAARAVGGGGTIRIGSTSDGTSYIVTIEDSGAGVPEGDRALIFEPFWTSRPAGEGTGLGLSLARTVVEQHGGKIALDSSPLGGARFTLTLPVGRTSQQPAPAQPAAS